MHLLCCFRRPAGTDILQNQNRQDGKRHQKNVDYGIFAQSFKSDIVNKQSLGRLLLRNEEKDECYLYDIVDQFPTKKLYVQGLSKIKLYKKEGHEYYIKNIK